jgi:hypothetical protein
VGKILAQHDKVCAELEEARKFLRQPEVNMLHVDYLQRERERLARKAAEQRAREREETERRQREEQARQTEETERRRQEEEQRKARESQRVRRGMGMGR